MLILNNILPALDTIAEAQTHARRWLFDHAAPLWSTAGVCSDGLFAERLSVKGERIIMPRRLMVQARQIFSFITIGALGWKGNWREIVENAVNILVTRGLHQGNQFIHAFDEATGISDSRCDLYDHAFALFALAYAGKALNRPAYFDLAGIVMDRMDVAWRRPEGGFWEGEISACPPYRQNPHMHMFEASWALYSATGEGRWKQLMHELADLFRTKFQDSETGAVTEYFDQSWLPFNGKEGRLAEPGHCMEWAWLFEKAFPDGSGIPTADRLVDFGRWVGICHKRGVAINEVFLDGTVADAAARLWPQTERLKIAVARYTRLRTNEEAREVIAAYRGLVPYLDTPQCGVWYDRWLADGSWVQQDAPASSFYHIVCSVSELLSCKA